MQIQDMNQNNFFLMPEAIKSWADTNHWKRLPGKDISLKTTQSFLNKLTIHYLNPGAYKLNYCNNHYN